MQSLALRGLLKKTDEGFIIIPATNADKTNLNLYANQADGKYLNLVFKSGSGSKTYAQVKTAWALISMLFIANKGRKPTAKERDILYEQLLEEYADREDVEDVVHHTTRSVPISFSKMTKGQLARFIGILIQLLHEDTQNFMMSDDDLVTLNDLFSEWVDYLSLQEVDPTDVNENGEYLTLDEYRATHTVSYASGRTCGEDGSDLEMAHIISRGSAPEFAECCWNVMMLTHEEHVGIMHGQETREGGWNALAARFPHIRNRISRAYAIGKHLYKLMDKEEIEL